MGWWVFFILLWVQEAEAARARITNVAVETIEQEIFVSFELKGGLNAKITRDIQNGIEKDFYYYVLLKKKYEEWFDQEVVEKTLRYTVKYDTVKKVYTVRRPEDEDIRSFDRIEALQAFVSQVRRVPLARQALLEPHQRYFVWVKAQMKASHVPLALDRFLFFIPFLDLDTPWVQSESLYAP